MVSPVKMKQCIKCLWEKNRRELESTLFKLLIILPHSQSEWHKDMFSFDHIKLSVHNSLPATASTLLTQHGAFFLLTFTDVSSDPHASELQAETKGKKNPQVFLCLQTQMLKHHGSSQPLPQFHCRLASKCLPGRKCFSSTSSCWTATEKNTKFCLHISCE